MIRYEIESTFEELSNKMKDWKFPELKLTFLEKELERWRVEHNQENPSAIIFHLDIVEKIQGFELIFKKTPEGLYNYNRIIVNLSPIVESGSMLFIK